MTATSVRSGQAPPLLTRQQIVDLARAAHQGPSIHNSQPWRLRARDDGLDVDEDLTRALPGTDPHGRERLISCGAALRNAEVAMARLGREPVTTLLPGGPTNPHLATLQAGAPHPPSDDVDALYRAIWQRRTHRRIFMATHSSDHLAPALAAAVVGFGARLAVLPSGRRARFAQLIWAAAQAQVRDDEVQRELAAWTGADRTMDGVPARSQGTGPFPIDGLLMRTRPAAETPPPWVLEDLAQGTVAVLLVPRDARLDWLHAGRALENLLLTLTAAGLAASFVNQAVQRQEFRSELAAMVDETGVPQMVLRIGHPLVTVPPTPRRPLSQVFSG